MHLSRLHPTLPRLRSGQAGSTFLTAALFAGVLAILVGGLLTYLTNEYILNQQAHLWNQALHLSEAATEIAFGELNFPYYQGGSAFQTSSGWTNVSSGKYTKTVPAFTNGLGTVIGNLSITVSNLVGSSALNPVIIAVGTATNTTGHAPAVARAIKTTLYRSSIFPVGLMSKVSLDMNGNNIYVDSYDSSDPTKSTTNGLYDATKKQANGNVASNGTFTNSVNIGNADVYGVAYTGVGGTVALGSGGSIGPTFVTADRATTASGANANGWIQSDFNVDVPSASLPSGASSWAVPSGTTGGNNITKDTTITTGDWQVGNLTLNSSAHGDTLTISGDVRLYVSGNVDVNGLGQIIINANSSLTVYVAGSVQLAGNGLVNNSTAPVKDLWYGLDTSTSWNVVGNAQLVAGIYAPMATVNIKGAGVNGDVSGGIVANKIVLTGNSRFHYDESLRQSTTGSGYAVVSWQELRNVSGNWVP